MIICVLHIHFICWYFFYLNSHKIEKKKKDFLFYFRNILISNYDVIITEILIIRVNSKFHTINFTFKTVLCLDDLALLDPL